MKVRINLTLPNGQADSFVLEGQTPEEIRGYAEDFIRQRHGQDPWSEILEE